MKREEGARRANLLDTRAAGVLLHAPSLPSGDLGADAFRFVDLLADSGLRVWQALPLGPTHDDGSPYNCLSAHAGSSRLISAERLVEWGWLAPGSGAGGHAHWLPRARKGFEQHASAAERAAFVEFKETCSAWLPDYALYQALRDENHGAPWWAWPAAVRDRAADALAQARARLGEAIAEINFEQFAFFRQWGDLRAYAHRRNVLMFGDMPIFVARDSAEVWAHREYFTLDAHGQPLAVAGVPPDYFSKSGQRWGNPLYDWARMERDTFSWWLARMRTQLTLFDLIRIDHFRGFEAYWEIPAAEETAINGKWVRAPGDALFERLHREFDPLPIVAEDLGLITPEVEALRKRHGIPGMAVLQFAFDGGPDNPYLPYRLAADTVVYTGTHDNDTTLGWFGSLEPERQRHVLEYLGRPGEPLPWPLIRAAFNSVARLAIVPLQDLLGLGSGHRMNTPGTTEGNWRWRFQWEQVPGDLPGHVRHLVGLYGRDGSVKG